MVLIWLFPFFWIGILKALTKRTKGSWEFDDKKDPESWGIDASV